MSLNTTRFSRTCRTAIASVSILVALSGCHPKTDKLSPAMEKAVILGDVEKVGSLISCCVDVNAKDKNGKTALMDAAIMGQTEVVRLLLGKGADANAKDKNGLTALDIAIHSITPLDIAIGHDQTETIDLLRAAMAK